MKVQRLSNAHYKCFNTIERRLVFGGVYIWKLVEQVTSVAEMGSTVAGKADGEDIVQALVNSQRCFVNMSTKLHTKAKYVKQIETRTDSHEDVCTDEYYDSTHVSFYVCTWSN